MNLEDETPVQATKDGGFTPHLSERGLFFTRTNETGIWYLAHGEAESTLALNSESFFSPTRWMTMNDRIFYLDITENDKVGLYSYEPIEAELELLYSDLDVRESEVNHVSFSISPDEQELLFSRIESKNSDIMLLNMKTKEFDKLAKVDEF